MSGSYWSQYDSIMGDERASPRRDRSAPDRLARAQRLELSMSPTGEGGPPIVQYWHSEKIPGYISELLRTVREENPHRSHCLFSERTAAEFIDEHFSERELSAFRACAVPAMQADYFRYCAIYAMGGIYVDADFACNRPLDSLLETKGQLFKHPNGPIVNGFFAFRASNHPLLAMTLEIATSNIESRWTNNVGFATGPLIFSGLERLRRAESFERLHETSREKWQPAIEMAERAVEIHGPIENAFDDVRISSRTTMDRWVRVPDQENLLYKAENTYWSKWRGSIYRPADRGP